MGIKNWENKFNNLDVNCDDCEDGIDIDQKYRIAEIQFIKEMVNEILDKIENDADGDLAISVDFIRKHYK